jgi:hypothetical protein
MTEIAIDWNKHEMYCMESRMPMCSRLGKLYRRSGYKREIKLKTTYDPHPCVLRHIFVRLDELDSHCVSDDDSETEEDSEDDDRPKFAFHRHTRNGVITLISLDALADWAFVLTTLGMHAAQFNDRLLVQTPELFYFERPEQGEIRFEWSFNSERQPALHSYCVLDELAITLVEPSAAADTKKVWLIDGTFAYHICDRMAVLTVEKTETSRTVCVIGIDEPRATQQTDRLPAAYLSDEGPYAKKRRHAATLFRVPQSAKDWARDAVFLGATTFEVEHMRQRAVARIATPKGLALKLSDADDPFVYKL